MTCQRMGHLLPMEGTKATVEGDKMARFHSCKDDFYMFYMPYSLPSTREGVGVVGRRTSLWSSSPASALLAS